MIHVAVIFIWSYRNNPRPNLLRGLIKYDQNTFFHISALEKLREEFKADSESLAHSEAISILSLDD